MNFILKHDLLTKIKAQELTILTEDTQNPAQELFTSIEAAQKELKSYISHRHDVALAMPSVWYYNTNEPRATGDLVVVYTENPYNAATTYAVDALVIEPETGRVYMSINSGNVGNALSEVLKWAPLGYNYNFYRSLSDDNEDPVTTTTSWSPVGLDPRDSLLKRMLIDLTLYDLHARIKPRQIPEHRIQLRDDTIKLLRDAADPRKNITLDLPLIDHGTKSGVDLTFGGNTKTTHSY